MAGAFHGATKSTPGCREKTGRDQVVHRPAPRQLSEPAEQPDAAVEKPGDLERGADRQVEAPGSTSVLGFARVLW
jgi:hypothetical protein